MNTSPFGLLIAYALSATAIQGAVTVLARKYGIGFWVLVPLIIVHQYFFLSVYTKAENFTLVWFSLVALTTVTALLIGHFAFQDTVSWVNNAGIALIVTGVALTKL
ncbi:MAG: hypothetical protein WAT84_00965 [Candidatus Moraniibacteriota bacterium]